MDIDDLTVYMHDRVICILDGSLRLRGNIQSLPGSYEAGYMIVNTIMDKFGDYPIVYHDSNGEWLELEHDTRGFTDFGTFRAKSAKELIKHIRKENKE